MIPKVLVCYYHRPMCVGLFAAQAMRQAGCQVKTYGPAENQVYGIEGWEDYVPPDFEIPRVEGSPNPINVQLVAEHVRAQGFNPDLILMVDQYDFTFLVGESDGSYKFAFWAIENFNAEQAQRASMRRADANFHSITHHHGGQNPDPPEGSEWLPFGFDPFVHPFLGRPRDRAVCQIGSPYEPRPTVWNAIRAAIGKSGPIPEGGYARQAHDDGATIFGRAPDYRSMAEIYNRSIVTISASNCDFSPMRTFEALAMGCIFVSDDVPAIRALLGPPRTHLNPGLWVAHDASVNGIVASVEEALAIPEHEREAMVIQGLAHSYSAHSYAHRARRILERVGLQGACRMI